MEPSARRGVRPIDDTDPSAGPMQTETGTVTLVQEDRFRLAADNGAQRLFILSHRARLRLDELQGLARSQRRVRVAYRDAEGLIAGAAECVDVVGRS